MRSENGKNFVGASTELKQSIKTLNQDSITRHLISKNTDWKFNPPVSPWMGVRRGGTHLGVTNQISKTLFKSHYQKQIIYSRIISIISLRGVINYQSATIVLVGYDLNDFKALTPNHFIIGSDCYNFSPGVFEKLEINLRWKQHSVYAAENLFWDRRKREYLPTLNIRRKWTKRYRIFSVGNLVLIFTKELCRSYWPMGY